MLHTLCDGLFDGLLDAPCDGLSPDRTNPPVGVTIVDSKSEQGI